MALVPKGVVPEQVEKDKSSAAAEMGDRLATTDMGRKVGRLLCPFREGAGSPNTKWPRPSRGLFSYQVAS